MDVLYRKFPCQYGGVCQYFDLASRKKLMRATVP